MRSNTQCQPCKYASQLGRLSFLLSILGESHETFLAVELPNYDRVSTFLMTGEADPAFK